MADSKNPEPIRLVAVERGFINNRLIEPGVTFLFNPVKADGSPRKLPKWAAPEGTPPKAKRVAGDLKPKDTQAAVKAKAEGAAGLV